ncbi:MAG: nuclear transport factor 2 family protein [Spirochaetia bacterium]
MNKVNASPSDVFKQLHEYVRNYDADGQADIFDANGVWEFPFATGNIPKSIAGKENIRKFGKTGMERSRNAGRKILQYNKLAIHQTDDANTIIVEFELEGEISQTKARYKIPYIQLLKVINGKIVLLRDYFSMEQLNNVLE